ncbi:hypothetical protein [Amycolatopsis anabasis]|uniref:hypothetical protein n=1 Tax=Amycolatopsis anabasis TaxID=1840409 RepID=UPI00131CAB38|nr:hypothetical protein [Amycolatopsis anabasis]
MFTFHHERADLRFSWDGWMQIKVRAGQFAPRGVFPDRFDIREPDLRDPARHPVIPEDGSVHFVPLTQEAFEALCDTWWRGREICVGLRDYAADPWQIRSWGHTLGAFRYRYTGGSHIEISPGVVETWHPLIDLARDARTPSTVSTVWLMNRVHGWEVAWLAEHGIVDRRHDLDRAIVDWTIANLPAPGARGSLIGQFDAWVYRQAEEEFGNRVWARWRNLGEPVRRVTGESPWSTTRDDPNGERWNFWWAGHHAYVYSPDRQLTAEQTLLAERDEALAQDKPTEWLQHRAEAWDINHP